MTPEHFALHARSIQAIYDRNAAVTDKALLAGFVQERDEPEDWISSRNTYAWYYAIAHHFRPRRIAEIGVRFGYSATAMMKGSLDAGVGKVDYAGFDNGNYIPGSNWVFRNSLSTSAIAHRVNAQLFDLNTQNCNGLAVDSIDLFHVDGDHTYAGAIHDLNLAREVTRDGGIILVDDVDCIPDVTEAARDWVGQNDLEYFVMPSLRGHMVIKNTREPKRKALDIQRINKKADDLVAKIGVYDNIRSDYCAIMLDELDNVPGDVIELGVGSGTTTKVLARKVQASRGARRFFACDTFSGLPYDEDASVATDRTCKKGQICTPRQHVEEQLSQAGVLDCVTLIEGMFEDTLTRLSDRQFAFAWVDADLYQSTLVAFEFLRDRMAPGSIIGFHDYHFELTPGVTRVVDQMVDRSVFREIFDRYTCIFFQRV